MAESSKERLVETAMELFYNHGFHAVGLDRVLTEVGVTKTTFYNHFESKDDLIIAALRRRDEIEMAEMRSLLDAHGADPRTALLAIFDNLASWFQHDDFRGCMFVNAAVEFPAPSDPIHRAAAAHSGHMFGLVRDLARRVGASDPDCFAKQVITLYAGALICRHVAMDKSAAATARAAVEALLEHAAPAGTR